MYANLVSLQMEGWAAVLYHLEGIFTQWEDQLKENYGSLGLKKNFFKKTMNQCS